MKKGFTLVELLAVIVILAVISIITIPLIGNVIKDSKRKALEISVNGIVEAANYFTISNEGEYEFIFDENKQGETITGKRLDYKGNIEAEGKLYIDKDGDISLCLMNEEYYVYKNYNSGVYIGEVKKDTCIVGYDAITSIVNTNKNNIETLNTQVNTNTSDITEIKAQLGNMATTSNVEAVNSIANKNKTDITEIKATIDEMNNHAIIKGMVLLTPEQYNTGFGYVLFSHVVTEPGTYIITAQSGGYTYTSSGRFGPIIIINDKTEANSSFPSYNSATYISEQITSIVTLKKDDIIYIGNYNTIAYDESFPLTLSIKYQIVKI